MRNIAQDFQANKTTVPVQAKIFSIKWNLLFMLTGLGLAIGLFYYGINVPFAFRLRGDAWSYMDIAHQFTTFSEALHYVGERTPGFPLFDYLFLYLDSNSNFLSKINHICLTLFIVHEFTALWTCFVCVKCRLFTTSSIFFGLLFLALAAYPAIVMHTTTPLSDVFGMDLLLIGFSLFAWAADTTSEFGRTSMWVCTILSGLISGSALSYAILVRPAYWLGVVGFLVVYILMIGVNRLQSRQLNYDRSMLMCIVIILTMLVVIRPVMDHCKVIYHALCLQDPRTFLALEHMKVGLGSARTAWNYNSGPAGVVPSYPDAFLVKNFQNRCPVISFTGGIKNDNSNLVSCLAHAPHLAVIYFIKKVTGLFDTFRMTPYTENMTPVWYLWVARIFSSIAFVGFWILLWEGIKGTYQLVVYRKSVSALIAATWCFCIIQVSVHSVLHVEERFAFPWIPFCMIAFFLKIKKIQEKKYSNNLNWMWLNFAALVIIGYFIEVLVWDYGMSHNVLS